MTPEKQALVRQVTGKDADVLELGVEELEERIAPGKTSAEAMTWK